MQLVGLKVKLAVDEDVDRLDLDGDAVDQVRDRVRPDGSVVIVSAAVSGFTSIFALTTTQSQGGMFPGLRGVVLEVERARLDRVHDRQTERAPAYFSVM